MAKPTANDVWNKIKALFDELSKNGVEIGEQANKDLELKAIQFIEMAQQEMIDMSKYIKTYTFSRKAFENQLGNTFDVKAFEGEDYFTDGVLAKTYSFKVNGPCTVVIQEYNGASWDDVTSLSITPTEAKYETFNGVTGTTNLTRLKFTGTTYYLFKDIALWNILFSEIPDYGRWIEITLPDDLLRFKDVNIVDGSDYGRAGQYNLEGEDKIFISHNFEGDLRINYYAIPPTVTALTDELEVEWDDVNYLAFYAATYLAPNEQPSLTVLFESKYLRLESKLDKPVQPGFVKIRDTLQIGRLGGI